MEAVTGAIEWARIWASFEFAMTKRADRARLAELVDRADRCIAWQTERYAATGRSAHRVEAFGWALVREAADRAYLVDPADRPDWDDRMRDRLATIQGVKR